MRKIETIEIDLELYKIIESHRENFNEKPMQILKRLIGFDNKTKIKTSISFKDNNSSSRNGLHYKGVLFPNGMQLRNTTRDGVTHYAIVDSSKFLYNDKYFTSPSRAAIEAMGGTATNGWVFWDYFNEKTQEWEKIKYLRK